MGNMMSHVRHHTVARFAFSLVAIGISSACSGDNSPNQADVDVSDATDVLDDTTDVRDDTTDASVDEEPAPMSGEVRVLTYNVAGLPQGLSSSNPETNIPQISPLLNAYDVVLVQEDFWYHDELEADVTHAHRSEPGVDPPDLANMGDGLNRFSLGPFEQHTRTPWPGCNGNLDCASDCLATKGVSFARHEIAPGVEVDIYNLHNEAGSCPEDFVIRDQSTDLLIEVIETQSEGRAVIVGGDFNLHERDEEDLALLNRLWDFGLRESCHEVECGRDHIDRIMVRNGDAVQLEVLEWSRGEEFVTEAGDDLSDHPAIWARIGWSLDQQ